MASFYGDTSLATKGWEVHHATEDNDEGGRDYVYVAIPQYCNCGKVCCSSPRTGWLPHTNGMKWYLDNYDDIGEAEEAANDWIENVQERLEADEEQYYEENHHAIAQMERYEMWQREY